ncbi:MAG: hypothetical protein Q8M76_03535, partial [Spirochaetaceae bacterium]|nr:hypothetical protein [Spirochaetaceae bacterium]
MNALLSGDSRLISAGDAGGAGGAFTAGLRRGRITRVAGPVVVAEGLGGAGLYDVVEVGEERLA